MLKPGLPGFRLDTRLAVYHVTEMKEFDFDNMENTVGEGCFTKSGKITFTSEVPHYFMP